MPNRILKESICLSEEIESLSFFEECFFYRLLVNCDDYGRFDGRTAVLRCRLFPLKQDVSKEKIEKTVDRLTQVGLLYRYESGGLPFLQVTTWEKHQRLRNSREKYPAPQQAENEAEHTSPQVAASCGELPQAAARAGAGARVYENPNPNPNPNPNLNPNGQETPSPPVQDGGEEKEKMQKQFAAVQNRTEEKQAAVSRIRPMVFGRYHNVCFTPEEFRALKQEFADWEGWIERLSGYMASTGKQYYNHLATLRSWAAKEKGHRVREPSYDIAVFERMGLRESV